MVGLVDDCVIATDCWFTELFCDTVASVSAAFDDCGIGTRKNRWPDELVTTCKDWFGWIFVDMFWRWYVWRCFRIIWYRHSLNIGKNRICMNRDSLSLYIDHWLYCLWICRHLLWKPRLIIDVVSLIWCCTCYLWWCMWDLIMNDWLHLIMLWCSQT